MPPKHSAVLSGPLAARRARSARCRAASGSASRWAARWPDSTALCFGGNVEQASYLGHGFRYRVRVGRGQIWVDDPLPYAEGSHTHVIVPREALLLFPTPSP